MAYDFRVQSNITRHPKFLELRDRCGDSSLWCVMDLWGYAAEYRPDGNLSGLSDRSLERVASWAGEPGLFIQTLIDAGLVDGEPMSRTLHDWQHRQAYLAARAARQEGGSVGGKRAAAGMTPEQRSDRARKAALAKVTAKVTTKVDANSHPIPSHPNTQPIDQNTPSISPVPGDGGEAKPEPVKNLKPAPVQLNRETFTLENLTANRIDSWTRDYPGVDIDAELAAINTWCKTATAKALKVKRWSQFIDNWMQKALADKAAGKRTTTGPQGKPRPVGVTDEDVAMFGDRFGNLPASIKLLRRMQHEQAQAGTDAATVEVVA
jgi:hypothetical protein